jgi:sigma-B regulation protein RsbU (phosphoserine phosphatase)
MQATRCVLLCASEEERVAEFRRELEQCGLVTAWQSLQALDTCNLTPYQLILLEGGHFGEADVQRCRRLRARQGDAFVPILYVSSQGIPTARLRDFEEGADSFLVRPVTGPELMGQVRALLRVRDIHDRLAAKTSEVHRTNRRLQQAYQEIDEELDLARRIQMSFLPQVLPNLPEAQFAVHYRLRGPVGGDFYDAFRLDENHAGFYVADAMGHGLPASLLTIFVKMGVKTKEVSGREYRLVPPSEVLDRINHTLIDQHLSDHPFITMAYGLLNHREGKLMFARAGHPYPLFVPRRGEPRLLKVDGSLLGVFATSFPHQTQELNHGDKVLFYSDGMDSARWDGNKTGQESLLACAERHRSLPIQPFVEKLARELFADNTREDDVTLLGVERS